MVEDRLRGNRVAMQAAEDGRTNLNFKLPAKKMPADIEHLCYIENESRHPEVSKL